MNLDEIEHAIVNHTYEDTYVRTWGVDKGKRVTMTREMEWDDLWSRELPEQGVEVPGVGLVQIEATHGGEGQGDQAWVVLRITDENGYVRFIRKDGYYASYEGTDFDGNLTEVQPREKTITVYE